MHSHFGMRRRAWRSAAIAVLMAASMLTVVSTAVAGPAAAAEPDLTTSRCVEGIGSISSPANLSSPPMESAWDGAGNLWLMETNSLDRMSPNGDIRQFAHAFTLQTALIGMAAGDDGNVWVSDAPGNRVGRVTSAGKVTWFTAGLSAGALPTRMTTGPDGNVWFVEVGLHSLGRITPDGVITEVPLGVTGTAYDITTGTDGNLWFSGTFDGAPGIGRMTPTGDVTTFPASAAAALSAITAGPDGNIWFSASNGGTVGRVTPAGVITDFTVPPSGLFGGSGGPFPSIAAGSDGNVWFTDQAGGRIGKVTPDGDMTFYTGSLRIDQLGVDVSTQPAAIQTGPDGNLWFTDGASAFAAERGINRITPDGVITQRGAFRQAPALSDVTPGPDGNIWYTASGIGRISPTGRIKEFPLDVADSGDLPYAITSGPDGNLWFTQPLHDRIGRITPSGTITWFSSGITAGSHPWAITAGPDGNLWFTEHGNDRLGRITPQGVVTEFEAGLSSGSAPVAITVGPDGNAWFTETAGVGRITPAGEVTEFDVAAGSSGQAAYNSITAGPDGRLWFTDLAGRIGRNTTSGNVTTSELTPTDVGLPEFEGVLNGAITVADIVAADGSLWFSVPSLGRVVRATTDGQFTGFSAMADNYFDVSNQGPFTVLGLSQPTALAPGDDGSLWVTGASGFFKVNHIHALDTVGEPCEPDEDGDGLVDVKDPKPLDPDADDDGKLDGADNCVLTANPSQADADHDSVGDACDPVAAISGTREAGHQLSAKTGAWDVSGLDVTYSWRRDGTPIAGASGAKYRLRAADARHLISVKVTATRDGDPAGAATAAAVRIHSASTSIRIAIKTRTLDSGDAMPATFTVTAYGVTPTGTIKVFYRGRVTRTMKLHNGKASTVFHPTVRGRHLLTVKYYPAPGFFSSYRSVWIRVN
jgi:streptogramin lyase